MLNCENGPDARSRAAPATPAARSPKAATWTCSRSTRPRTPGIDNVREVIISGLAILPVRDRYKIFIIDEVHQLSASSFNALLKSIEEPPPHVAFIMATTAPDKIPDTIVSRSQVFEFKTISSRAHRRAADEDREGRRHRRVARGHRAGGALGRRQHARRRDGLRPGDCLRRQHGHRRRRGHRARPGRPRPALRRDDGRGRRERRRRRSSSRAAPSRRATTCGCCAASCRASSATCWCCRSTRRASRIPTSRPRPIANGSQALVGRVLARGPAAVLRRAGARRERDPRRGRAALQLRDGAAALDSPAQADAARRPDRAPRERRAAPGAAGAAHLGPARPPPSSAAPRPAPSSSASVARKLSSAPARRRLRLPGAAAAAPAAARRATPRHREPPMPPAPAPPASAAPAAPA